MGLLDNLKTDGESPFEADAGPAEPVTTWSSGEPIGGYHRTRSGSARFRNPVNGYTVTVGSVGPFLGCLFFGAFYFAFRGVWRHFLFSIGLVLVLAFTTGPGALVPWLIYPFFAPGIVRRNYLDRGWKPV